MFSLSWKACGGGHLTNAATQMEAQSIEEVKNIYMKPLVK